MITLFCRRATFVAILIALPLASRAQEEFNPLDCGYYDSPPIIGITAGPLASWFAGNWSIPSAHGDTISLNTPHDGTHAGQGWTIAVDFIPRPEYTVIGASARFQHLTAEWSVEMPVARILNPSTNEVDSTVTTARTSYAVDIASLEGWVGVPVWGFREGWLLVVGGADLALVTNTNLRQTFEGVEPTKDPRYPTEANGLRAVLYDDRVPEQASLMAGVFAGFRAEFLLGRGYAFSLDVMYSYHLTRPTPGMQVSSARVGVGFWMLLWASSGRSGAGVFG